MTRFAFTVEYDGRPYMGWQRQAHGPSVQQCIEEALGRIAGGAPIVHCAGRTDAGVHALAMRAHVDLDKAITPFRLMEALNAHLRPEPIAILTCEIVPEDWHARFSCVARAYEYRILNRRAPLTFERGLVWRVPQVLDAERMHEAAQALVGRHDFTTFRSAQCQADSPHRTLARLDVMRVGERITVHAKARSFLHHQVRSMVGCLALVGTGTWSPDDLKAALDARNRAALGHNAPPDGLYFIAADYPLTA
ncbi:MULTISPECIES: tRNA pseudouridine(38-40) synthase TruA [unclassified Sphingobium]|uniref:tRNA pseudouridine(38-40) synthase TruA n=1 Tax=unclassified Sphingobium TaxID=2611147 RepID=UPI00222461AE|nr:MULTISPECIES: tRNA pseudouridine(38-40) synthase TruA [unclassified Sphingobium]MCW2411870.1 tRNA pseudouridine38-40 synthase [Sphingobium sp. B8D3D]MCW2415832.1 tRNA pseudouridine38-40 synthase [Sphingobium sp. B8D3A]